MMKKKFTSVLLALCMASVLPGSIFAEESTSLQPASTNNFYRNGYNENYPIPINSYLYEGPNGSLTRVEFTGGSRNIYESEKIIVEEYGDGFTIQSQKEIEPELSLWGGFFSGTDYNFLIFGQSNNEEDDSTEVIRVVKYSKDWERLDAASLYGANTTEPFSHGGLSAVQDGDKLFIRTCHRMYTSDDGLNHQANLTFSVNIPTMKISNQFSKVMNTSCGYASHSFNQFIALDGSTLVAADHGDAYPRGIALFKYKSKTFTNNDYDFCDFLNVLPIKGKTGDNTTGAALTGLSVSSTSYLTVGRSVAQDDTYNPSGQKNIFVTSTPKNNFSEQATKLHWITSYRLEDKIFPSAPKIVNLGNDQMILLYETERTSTDAKVNYIYLDGNGNPTSDVFTMNGFLSNCDPVFYHGLVVWYYTKSKDAPVFCIIDGNGNGFFMPAAAN